MKKIQLISFAIVLFLLSTNWFNTKTYDRTVGITKESFDASTFGLIFAVASTGFLGRQAYKSFRELLDRGIKIEKERRLFSNWPSLLLLPLLFRSHATEITILEDGTKMTQEFGYGSDQSIWLLAFGSITVILFQLVAQLEFMKKRKGEPVGPHNSGHRSAMTSA